MYLKIWMKKWLWSILICVFLLFICFLLLLLTTVKQNKEPSNEYVINQIRLQVNNVLLYIEDHFTNLEQNLNLRNSLQEMSNSQDIDITVVQLDGRIIYNSIEEDPSQFISLKDDLHYDLFTSQQLAGKVKIAFPIINDKQEQIGNAIFTIDQNVLLPVKRPNHFMIIVISGFLCLFIIGLALYMIRKANKEILLPLHNLKKSTEEIVKGNYEQKTVYPRVDEIGDLYAVFDQMRLEIKKSYAPTR